MRILISTDEGIDVMRFSIPIGESLRWFPSGKVQEEEGGPLLHEAFISLKVEEEE